VFSQKNVPSGDVECSDDRVVQVFFDYGLSCNIGARVFQSSTGRLIVCDPEYRFLIAGSLDKDDIMLKGWCGPDV